MQIVKNTTILFDPPFVADLSQYKTKKRHNSLCYNLLCRYELRRQDSNMRPPGYEPGELPTAPLRDINHFVCNSDL